MGKKNQIVLCDTNILFGLLNGDIKVKLSLEKIGAENIGFPIITQSEAYSGASKEDFKKLKSFFNKYKTFHLDIASSEIFNGLIQSHHYRHSKWIPDALIAAIALSNDLELYTLNRKDFDFIENLKLYNP